MTSHLVSTQWLEEHLHDPELRLVDIRGQVMPPDDTESAYFLHHYEDYLDQHIPGARFVNWIEDITDDPQHKRVAPLEEYASAMGKLGISNENFIVAYDDAGNTLASRLWWTLNYYGHNRIAVLDGGWTKWLAEDRPTTPELPEIEETDFKAEPHKELLRQGHEILDLLGGTTRIVDTRSPAEYDGNMSFTRFSGHIPGAVNLPPSALLNEDSTLLAPDKLRHQFAMIDVDDSAPEVVFYGNVGVSSCLGILAMRVAGLTAQATNYDASWGEWGNDPRKPKS